MALVLADTYAATIFLAVTLSIFGRKMYLRLRYLFAGKGREPRWDHIPTRIRNFIVYGIFQRKVAREWYAGVLHSFIFWAFVILGASVMEITAQAFARGWQVPTPSIQGFSLNGPLYLAQDIVAVLGAAGVGMALFRRYVVRPKKLMHEGMLDATIVLCFILGIVATVIPFSLFLWGLARIGPSRAGIVSTLEPLSAAVIAYFWLSQSLGGVQIAGAALVYLSFVLDCVDGQLARYTRRFSKFGGYLDSVFDRTKEYVAFAGLAIILVGRRETGVLKRLRATPLPPATYIAAVLLSTLLREAGVDPRARWVVAEGFDAAAMTRSIPLEKAWEDVLVAYGQNGEALRPAQGYPVRLVVPGWGFLANNELTDFNFDSLTHPNRVEGGKRPRSSMSPTIVLDDGEPLLALGSPGGSMIITTVLQILVDRLDLGATLPEALAEPRASQRNTATTVAEPAFISTPEGQALAGPFGHVFSTTAEIGAATGIEFLTDGRVLAVAEPVRRGGGSAMVEEP